MTVSCKNCKHAQLSTVATAKPYYCEHLDTRVTADNRCADYRPIKGIIEIHAKHADSSSQRAYAQEYIVSATKLDHCHADFIRAGSNSTKITPPRTVLGQIRYRRSKGVIK